MDFTQSSLGWLVPAWIIGAPLVAAVVMLMATPKGGHRSTYPDAGDRTGRPGTMGSRDNQVPPR